MADTTNQIVYVLTNPAMPGLVKIGKTTQFEIEERMKQLYVLISKDGQFQATVVNEKKV
jgi:hypothetical protein